MADPTAAEAARAEIVVALKQHKPILEGLRDFARLNLRPETAAKVANAITDYERRQAHLEETERALTALLQDGYPDLPVREVEQDVFDDLQDQAESIDAALAKFTPEMAARLNLTRGATEPKPL